MTDESEGLSVRERVRSSVRDREHDNKRAAHATQVEHVCRSVRTTAGECSPDEPLGCRSKAEHTVSSSSLSAWLSPSISLLNSGRHT